VLDPFNWELTFSRLNEEFVIAALPLAGRMTFVDG
jgi:hypothetical protein